MTANPSPGNKKGVLANVVEKILSSIAKSGQSQIVDVLSPGERVREKGLAFAATPNRLPLERKTLKKPAGNCSS